MNDMNETKAAPKTETDDEKLARMRARQAEREAEQVRARRAAELERFDLLEKYERELGKEGVDFFIYDATKMGLGFFVLKRGDALRWQVFLESKMTPADRYDFIEGCVVHPAKEVYQAARASRPGIDIVLGNELGKLYGFHARDLEGK